MAITRLWVNDYQVSLYRRKFSFTATRHRSSKTVICDSYKRNELENSSSFYFVYLKKKLLTEKYRCTSTKTNKLFMSTPC